MLSISVLQCYLGHRKQRSHRHLHHEKCVQGKKVKVPDSCFAQMSTEGCPQAVTFCLGVFFTLRCLKAKCLEGAAVSSVQSGEVSYHTPT